LHALLILGVVVGSLALWLTLDSRFYVYEARIEGARSLTREEVFGASGLNGLHILWARPASIESQILEGLPRVERAEASCRMPSSCSISIVERRPRVLWDENGERWWIDDEGTIFAHADELPQGDALAQESGQWSVTGPLPRAADGNLDPQVRVALEELWESGQDLPGVFLFSPDQGLSFVDERGWRVVVGVGSGMERRLRVLEDMTAHLASAQVTPRFVDVRFPEAPYYAPRTE